MAPGRGLRRFEAEHAAAARSPEVGPARSAAAVEGSVNQAKKDDGAQEEGRERALGPRYQGDDDGQAKESRFTNQNGDAKRDSAHQAS